MKMPPPHQPPKVLSGNPILHTNPGDATVENVPLCHTTPHRAARMVLVTLLCLTPVATRGEELPLNGRAGRDLLLKYFRPRPALTVAAHHLTRARFPVVDVHTHFRYKRRNLRDGLDAYIDLMNRHNIAICASLDGKLGEDFAEHRAELWKQHRQRFVIFVNIDFQGNGTKEDPSSWDCQRPDFARRVARQLAEARQQGASGLKLFKQFGLGFVRVQRIVQAAVSLDPPVDQQDLRVFDGREIAD